MYYPKFQNVYRENNLVNYKKQDTEIIINAFPLLHILSLCDKLLLQNGSRLTDIMTDKV